jgi:hypothetical protein
VTATTTKVSDSRDPDDDPRSPRQSRPLTPAEQSRRRFIIAVVVGCACVLPAVLWVMWDLWSGSVSPLRAVTFDNFYDLQARAMFHGHFYVQQPLNFPALIHGGSGYTNFGALQFEGFVHGGHSYTYFGLFPSIIRMPILLLTSSFDGSLTAPSILLAWVVTALFSSLMFWRLRIIMRGDALLGRSEATAFGALMATIMGGSVILYLASTPWVYNEDFAWSVALTVGSLFALLGMLERPSKGRAIATGALILCANLDRTPTGYACVIAALLAGSWFALGGKGASNRRWALPVLAAGFVPFLVGCAVNYAKFGIPVGLPLADQVWTKLIAHRRYFLAVNGGKEIGFQFLPSTLWAYFQPFGLRISGLFPFVAPPAAPAAWLGGVVLDTTYPTASFTATDPLLFLLSCWGAITAFRPRGIGQVRLTRIVLLGGAAGASGVLLWGYIDQRYLADLIPFFIIACGVGLIDVWRRLEVRSRRARRLALGTTLIIAVYCIVANVGVAVFPVEQWTPQQGARFISAEKSLSLDSLADSVQVGTKLPYWGPAGAIFATDNCSGLYLSNGNEYGDIPGQQLEHYTWTPIEQSAAFTKTFEVTFDRSELALHSALPLVTYGASTLVLAPTRPGDVLIEVEHAGGPSYDWPPSAFPVLNVSAHKRFRIAVTIDPNLNSISVQENGVVKLHHYIRGAGPAVVRTGDWPRSDPLISVVGLPSTSTSDMSLCRSLLEGRSH